MNRILLSVVSILLTVHVGHGQKVSPAFGDEIKVKKGTTEINILYADKSGVYLQEGHVAVATYFVIGTTLRGSATLVKMGNDLSPIFKKQFNKELKGKNFEKFIFLNNKLFMLGSALRKGDDLLRLHAAELDKNSGEMKGDWFEVANVGKVSKQNDFSFMLNYNFDSTAMVLVTALEAENSVTFTLKMFDDKMKEINTPLVVNYPVEPKKFEAQSLIYTKAGNLLLVNKLYEYREGKKEKKKFLDFKSYDMRLYGHDGKLIKQVNTNDIDGRTIVASRTQEMADGSFLMAAFYANSKKSSDIKGILFLRIDPNTGDVIGQGAQELSTAMLAQVESEEDDDDDEESAKEKRERKRFEKLQEKDDGLSRDFQFRHFVPTPDGGAIVMAEEYWLKVVASMQQNGGINSSYYDVFGKLLFLNISPQNKIEWLHLLPKKQQIHSRTDIPNDFNGFYLTQYLQGNYPTHGSVGSVYVPAYESMLVFFNDNKKNSKVLNVGQKIKMMTRPGKADFNMLVVNTKTGNYTRKVLFNNEEVTDPVPNSGTVIGNNYFMVCQKLPKTGLGKFKIALSKLTIK